MVHVVFALKSVSYKTMLFLVCDVSTLNDISLLFDFREIKVHRKKVKKAFAKKNKDLADRLLNRPPTYKLDRLILERYQV